jgi:hypothetical protein
MRTLEPGADDTSAELTGNVEDDEFNVDIQALEEQLALPKSREEMMKVLVELMSPTTHHTPSGLMATRIFSWMLDEQHM